MLGAGGTSMLPKDEWTAVDRYLNEALLPYDAVLEEALRANAAAGLPEGLGTRVHFGVNFITE
jgi:hypothetical protein